MKKMQFIPGIFLAAMILLQSASLLLVDAGYNANHSYIAAALCMNRDKPQMHCDGKCFLKKELSKQQEKESSSQRTGHQNSSVTFFCEEISSYHFFNNDKKFLSPFQNIFYSPGFLATKERPPNC